MQGLEYATVFYFVIKAIVLFSGKVRIVKLVSVNEDFVFAMTLLGKEDESSVAVTKKMEPQPHQALPPTRCSPSAY